jgi:hypothetical protein
MIKKLMPYVLIVAFLVTNACCLHAETESVNLFGLKLKILYYGDFLNAKERADVIKNQKVKLPMELKSWPPSDYKFSPDDITVKAVFENTSNKKLSVSKCIVRVDCFCLKRDDQDNGIAKIARKLIKQGVTTMCEEVKCIDEKELQFDIDGQSEKTIEIGHIDLVYKFDHEFTEKKIMPVLFRTQITISDIKLKSFDLTCDAIWEDD